MMKNTISWLFSLLNSIGVIALTLSFFGVGKDFVNQYLMWFLSFLWIGMVGRFIMERMGKLKEKE